MIEYLNPQNHTIQLSTPDKKIIKVPANAKVIMSEWYLNYCPKYLRVVREVGATSKVVIPKNIVKYNKNASTKNAIKPTRKKRKILLQNKTGVNAQGKSKTERHGKTGARSQSISRIVDRRPVVGRQLRENGRKVFSESCQQNDWSVSNNVGIGILSYNRLSSVQRLISSIRRHTDLSKTTVFVSDESTSPEVKKWLKKQTDIVVMTDQKRLGIAGNSNRLLRCLSRFKHCFLLNDDVEILKRGWEQFYVNAATKTGFRHFCYHQIGVYGAKRDGKLSNRGGYRIETIAEKPHGAVIFYTQEIFDKVGFFDERFGMYGAEHVDWSERVSFSGLQPKGYHDIVGSERYFKIHKEKSVVPDRSQELQKGRETYRNVRDPRRVRVEATTASEVPSATVIIPLRNIGRQGATETVINHIRSQLFPNIEIILCEQDQKNNFSLVNSMPCRYVLAKSKYPAMPFTKAIAFNLGVAKATYSRVILQDADIVCPSNYVAKVCQLLNTHEGVHIGSKVMYLSKVSSQEAVKNATINNKLECERAVGYFEGGSLACTKSAYFRVGGFNEIFEGYGVEDCDFFDRLKNFSKFFNTRTEDFVHLWHGRTTGWERHHRRNKKIALQIGAQYSRQAYVSSLVAKIRSTYPEVAKELGI